MPSTTLEKQLDFLKEIDRLQNDISFEQVLSRYGPVIERGAPQLWAVCEQWVTQLFARQSPAR